MAASAKPPRKRKTTGSANCSKASGKASTPLAAMPIPAAARWEFILRHARLAVAADPRRDERHVLMRLRARLMAYSKGLPGSKHLRARFCHVASLAELEDLAGSSMSAPPAA